MFATRRHILALLTAAAFVCLNSWGARAEESAPVAAEDMLAQYVNAPDPTCRWEKGPAAWDDTGSLSDILLTSQTWRGITWKHLLRLAIPAEVKYPGWMLLYITGGSGEARPGRREGQDAEAIAIARAIEAPVAVLYRVPNQPLFDGMVEDEIISYTFQNYMMDADPTWPLLFPMTKSAARAMDALQQYAKREWQQEIHSFVVFGHSKRGWTTWLTAAADRGKRVKAIAPAVFDNLNIREQMPHQVELWGAYSEEIDDYSSKGLTELLDTPRGRMLVTSVDPYTFRANLTMPKLILNGSNDPYWATDALNYYWDDLVGPKYVLYAPNRGHGIMGSECVPNTLSAFFRTVAAGKAMPEISWTRQVEGDTVTLTIKAPQATGARAWAATADDLDFRPQTWRSTEMAGGNGVFTVTIARPADKNIAVFGEADFTADGRAFTLSTQNAILKK
ncbi:MAG: phenylacetic acid degradation protein [Armatimonadota bacterium]|nr:MAG: phenylacetic acid degradation protein [Armatimonadota bacterium]